MAGFLNSLCTVLIAAVVIAAVAPPCEAELDCGSVASYMNPCLPYFFGSGPLGGCCGGVTGLYSAAEMAATRQSVCRCLKSLANSNPGTVDLGRVVGLPTQCGVSIPYEISPSLDCSQVK